MSDKIETETTEKPAVSKAGSVSLGALMTGLLSGGRGEVAEAVAQYILGEHKKSFVAYLYDKIPVLSHPRAAFFIKHAPLAATGLKIATKNSGTFASKLEGLAQDFLAELKEGYQSKTGSNVGGGTAQATVVDQATGNAIVDKVSVQLDIVAKFSLAIADISTHNVPRASEILQWYSMLDSDLRERFDLYIGRTSRETLGVVLSGQSPDHLTNFAKALPKPEPTWQDDLEILSAMETDAELKALVDLYTVYLQGLLATAYAENFNLFVAAVKAKTNSVESFKRLLGYMALTPPVPEKVAEKLGIVYRTTEPKNFSLVQTLFGEDTDIDGVIEVLDNLQESADEALIAAKERWQ